MHTNKHAQSKFDKNPLKIICITQWDDRSICIVKITYFYFTEDVEIWVSFILVTCDAQPDSTYCILVTINFTMQSYM